MIVTDEILIKHHQLAYQTLTPSSCHVHEEGVFLYVYYRKEEV